MVRLIKQSLLVVIILTCNQLVIAQNLNYMVFFTDKANSPYSISQPGEFLSARAIARRTKQQISVIEEDLPVNTSYLEGIESVGTASVRYATKWMNGALIQATSSEAESIKLLPYVTNIEFVAPGNVGGRIQEVMELDSLYSYESDTLFQFDILGVSAMRANGNFGQDMMIAIMDGGFEGMNTIPAFAHLYDENRVIMTYDYISNSSNIYQYSDHGTKVTSLLAAEQKNPDYAGVIPGAKYLFFVTEDVRYEYRVEEYRWLIAAEKADSAGTDIISTSLGYNIFDDPTMDYTRSELDGVTSVITRAAQKAANKGIFMVISGGNTGNEPWGEVLFPADIVDGLAVGSITRGYTPSNLNPNGPSADGRIKPDVVANGAGAYLINGSGKISTSSGTSYSAPVVAGLAAGIWQEFPNTSTLDLLAAFRESSSNATLPDNEIGYGVPSYQALRNYLDASENESWFAIYPNPVADAESLKVKIFDPIENEKVQFDMYDTTGKVILTSSLNITWMDNEYILETSTLPQGIYILNLQSGTNSSKVKILKL